jgi:Integrase zinc binding domain
VYSLRNGLLHFNEKVCVPIGNKRLSLLQDTHDIPSAGHLGVKKTATRLYTTYHCKSLKNTVQDYVKSCDICQRTKNRTQKPFGLLQPLSVPTQKWARISMDFITPLPKTSRGNAGLFVVVDRLSKLTISLPHPRMWTPQKSPVYFILTSIDTTDFLLRSSLIVIPYS